MITAKDFVVEWEPVLPSGAQWAVLTHGPTKRTFRLKAAKCVRKTWKRAGDNDLWVRPIAVEYLTRELYDESAEGIKARAIADAGEKVEQVKAITAELAQVNVTYPDAKLPTITVTAAAMEIT